MTMTPEYHRRYYVDVRRPKILAYLGGDDPKCVICGSRENLECDHIDPESKTREISANSTISNPLVRAELDKCQLLCKACHQDKTSRENSARGWTHGTIYGWMRKKCACVECSTAKRAWYDARNAARRAAYAPANRQYRRRDEPALCGEVRTYKRGCRCDACRAGNAKRARELYAAKRKA